MHVASFEAAFSVLLKTRHWGGVGGLTVLSAVPVVTCDESIIIAKCKMQSLSVMRKENVMYFTF